jgi:Acyltransferase family
MQPRPDDKDQVVTAPVRIAAFDRARTFITLLVLLHHSVVNYTYFGNGDRARWLGFDLIVLFNDSFFMACMFMISGLFVRDSLTRRGPANFIGSRAWRLGIPYLISIFALMPIAYYPTFLRYHLPSTTDFNFFHFWWRTLTIGPWPSGPAWFLWVLLALDAIAALIWVIAPGAIKGLGKLIYALRYRPGVAFVLFMIVSVATYLPMHLTFGDTSWLEPDGFPLPIQTSRIFLYAGYFFFGVSIGAADLRTGLLAENGELAARWKIWSGFALAFYGLCPPQLGRLQRAAVLVARGLRPCLCAVQCRDGVRRAGTLPPLCESPLAPAGCHDSISLRHLSRALRFHHLPAIRRV